MKAKNHSFIHNYSTHNDYLKDEAFLPATGGGMLKSVGWLSLDKLNGCSAFTPNHEPQEKTV